ncbi:hypothetical protein FJY63_04245 [Candidatus Sumerlaeota bacterium]|nr:hypothetical protein [Candidatus Sumerlaeota bacterium]
MEDPIVEEIRSIRRQIEEEHGNDMDRLLEHVYEEQRKHPERFVRRKPRPLVRQTVV